MSTVKIKLLSKTARAPQYLHEGDSGMDLYADILGQFKGEDPSPEYRIYPGERFLISSGISISITSGFEGQIRSRSGLALNQALVVLNSPGTIDSNYRGPVGIILYNAGSETRIIKHGDRIAQLVICPIARVTLEVVEDLDSTDRGEGGFGSTGLA